jgi:hypothetical protein
MRRGVNLAASAVCLAGAAFLACRDTTGVDRLPPLLVVLSPTATTYDTNGDCLVDFDIAWSDAAGSGVDPVTARVRSLDGLDGPADTATNLLTVWPVDRRDGAGIAFRETRSNMLRSGTSRIEISVADAAGHRITDTIIVVLPRGAFWKTIPSGLPPMGRTGSFAIDFLRRRLYLAHSQAMVVFDLDSLNVLATVWSPVPGLEFNRIRLTSSGELCMTEFLRCLDPETLVWGPDFNSAQAIALAESKADDDLLYLGETYTGTIGIYSKSQHARIGTLPYPPNPYNDEFVSDIVVLAGDTKLYETRSFDGIILVLDPRTGAVLARIPSGDPLSLELSRDERFLYASPRVGAQEIDTRTDSVTRVFAPAYAQGIDARLSPDGRLLFLVTQDVNVPNEPYSNNYLIDVNEWRVVSTFPRPRPAGQVRYDQGVIFHPSGKLAFVAHNLDLDVYVIRK